MKIRNALPADADRCVAIFRLAVLAVHDVFYSEPQRRSWASADSKVVAKILAPGSETLVAADGDLVAGFATLIPGASTLEYCFVDPQHQGRGVGRALLLELLDRARALGLSEVTTRASLNAMRFYEAQGFRTVGCTNHCNAEGVEFSCVQMKRSLEPV